MVKVAEVIDEQKASLRNGEFPPAQETEVPDIRETEEEELLLERWKNWAEAVDR